MEEKIRKDLNKNRNVAASLSTKSSMSVSTLGKKADEKQNEKLSLTTILSKNKYRRKISFPSNNPGMTQAQNKC